jgi:formiminotetrahydrofolate cyclodeaminase
MYINQSLKKYLDDLASRTPTPGGGSAASATSALACALLSMVANFTVGNPKYKETEETVKEYLEESEKLRLRFMELIDLDVSSYEKVYQAQKMPKEMPEEKTRRKEKIQEVTREAVAVPLEICQLSAQGLKLCQNMLDKTNINLISDLAVAASLLKAGFKSGLINVEINLSYLEDADFIVKIRQVLEPLEKESEVFSGVILERVKEKINEATT